MPLWGNSTANESKPKYLHVGNIHHHYDPNKCYATMRGWEIVDENDIPELLVAIPGLSDSLVAASVSALEWGIGNYYSAGTQTVVVVYNEQVVVTGHPRLVVTGSITGAITATHTANYRNKVTFTFTIPDGVAQSFTVANQSIDLNSGTITDADGLLSDSSLVITAPVATAIHPLAAKVVTVESVTLAALSAGTYYGTELTHTATLTFSAPVTVGSSGSAPVFNAVWKPAGAATSLLATYASGSGTNALVFTLAGIPDEAGSLSLGLVDITIGGTKTLRDALGGGVSRVIPAAVASAVVAKVVAPPVPVSVAFQAAPLVKNTAGYLTVTYDRAVDVTIASPKVLVTWSVGPTTFEAVYASGTGTTALRFNYTVPNQGGTASIVTQGITLAVMKGTHGESVERTINSTIATAAGARVVAA